MVEVTVEANELKNGKIEKISLVRNGAIRQPFKILKTDEIPAVKSGVGEKLTKFFGNDNDEHAGVAALFVRKSAAAKWLPLIKANGFRAEKEHAEVDGDMVILKQEGYDPDFEGSMVALSPDVAIMLNQVVKGFDPYSISASFDENVKASAFYPGMFHALESLADTVWNVMNEAESNEAAAAGVAKQVKAFGAYIQNMVNELPKTVFKMEHEGLTKKFEGSNVSSSQTENVTKSEDDMTKTQLREAAPGDLDGLLDDAPAADAAIAKADEKAEEAAVEKADDGFTIVFLDEDGNEISEEQFDELNKGCGGGMKKGKKMKKDAEGNLTDFEVEKSGDAGAPKSGGSPGNSVVESTSDTGAVSLDEGGVPAGFRKEERTMKSVEDGKLVEKTGLFYVNDETQEEIFGGFIAKAEEEAAPAEETAAEYTPAEVKLFEALGVMAKGIAGLKETVEKTAARIDDIEKTADAAKETADNTVVMGVQADLDESLATISGHQQIHKSAPAELEKADDDIFKGLLPQIESAV